MNPITFRRLEASDFEAILRLMGGLVSAEALHYQASAPNLHPYEDFMIAVTADSDIVGLAIVGLQAYSGGGFLHLILHPHYITSIADMLLDHACERLLDRADIEKGAGTPLWVYADLPENHPYLIDIMTRNGFLPVRRFQHMAIELMDKFELNVPAGIIIRPFERQYTRLVHQAEGDAFSDHWGNTKNVPFEVWEHQFAHPSHDDNLCFIAWDRDEIAGVSLCMPSEGETDLCHIETLSVRPAWRKRGLGLALLNHSFNAFLQAGYHMAE
jgi:N-acetylglutamate synthase-like GNAT family acetyltransferase